MLFGLGNSLHFDEKFSSLHLCSTPGALLENVRYINGGHLFYLLLCQASYEAPSDQLIALLYYIIDDSLGIIESPDLSEFDQYQGYGNVFIYFPFLRSVFAC